MEIWSKIFKGVATVAGAVAGYVAGGWNALLTTLVVLMVLDYVTGLIVAAFGLSPKTETGGLSSKAGFLGLVKKMAIIVIVIVATFADKAINTGSAMFQTAAVCFYIANEGLSILENVGLMGVPIPEALRKALEIFRKKGEGDEDDDANT